MTAKLRAGLGSYRDFKSTWTGRPAQAPDAHSIAVQNGKHLSTLVHVSWNGATEVATWKLWRSDPDSQLLELLTEAPRQGFETAIRIRTLARYVLVEAVDRSGATLGKSEATETIVPADRLSTGHDYISNAEKMDESMSYLPGKWSSKPILSYIIVLVGIIITIGISGLVWCGITESWKSLWGSWIQRRFRYEPLPEDILDSDESHSPLAATRSRTEGG